MKPLFDPSNLKDNPAFRAAKKFVDATDEQTARVRKQLESLWANNSAVNDAQMATMLNMVDTYRALLEQLVLHPVKTLESEGKLITRHAKLLANTARRCIGQEVEPVAKPDRGDRRFNHDDWSSNPFFDYIKQSYLINSQAILDLVQDLEDSKTHTHAEFIFYTRQLVNALSPSNLPVLNPEVLNKLWETKGGSALQGFQNFMEDIQRNPKLLNIAMTDYSAFKVGGNIATTPGAVVFENRLFQLIQYKPTTEKVNATPLLIMPPWINKFYILDLKAKNSFIKWAVDQGHTVFVMSWRNPGPEMAETTFDDYITEGSLEAFRVVKEITEEPQINVIGYCIGGTLLGSTLAHLAVKDDLKQIKSATYFTTLLDFSDPGEIGIFVNEDALSNVEKYLDKVGYFDGRAMAFSFNLLRENDLYWSYFVNNYLKGEKPPAFDLLYWNSDGTNLPAAMHKFYLRNMYLYNKLIKPDALTLAGTPIDLGKIDTPAYFLSAEQDHIAKWKSTYKGALAHQGKTTFVLSGSGHIAGVINPAREDKEAEKYGYKVGAATAKLPEDPDQWLESAKQHKGSWWHHWENWMKSYKGKQVPAREPGSKDYPALEPAPGSYVKQRIADVLK